MEYLAHRRCSWDVNIALLHCKVHALLTIMVFCSSLGPGLVKLTHLLSIFIHFPPTQSLSEAGLLGLGQFHDCVQ